MPISRVVVSFYIPVPVAPEPSQHWVAAVVLLVQCCATQDPRHSISQQHKCVRPQFSRPEVACDSAGFSALGLKADMKGSAGWGSLASPGRIHVQGHLGCWLNSVLTLGSPPLLESACVSSPVAPPASRPVEFL